MSSMGKTLLILEDDERLMGQYEKIASSYFPKLLLCNTLEKAKDSIKKEIIDAAILDHCLPDGEGTELLDYEPLSSSTFPVVLITGHAEKQVLIESINKGVCYFLEKPVDLQQIRDALGKIQEALSEGAEVTDLKQRYEILDGTKETLRSKYKITQRELEIIKFCLSNQSNEEIGSKLFISSKTVKTHLQNIFEKLSLSSKRELADFIVKINKGA